MTQPPPSNLKERIAALQQCSDLPSPATRPTSPPPRDASLTPPRGSLRDKIAKFERKGGVPIPRSSFGMAAAPPEEVGSTKSRELYGNRVAALGKGRPTALGNSAHRAVSSPTPPLASPASRTSPDDNAAKSAARLTPNSIGNSVSSSIKSPSRRNSSGFTDTDRDRPTGPHDVPGGSDESQEPSGQLATDAQPDSLSETQDAKASEPIAKPIVSAGRRPLSVSSSPLSTGLVVTNIIRSDASSNPLRSTTSEATPTQTGSLYTPVIHEPSPPPAESHTQEHAPVLTPRSVVSTVQAHISVEQVPVKDANLLGVRPDRPPQNGSLEISSTHSEPSSDTQLPSSNTNSLKGGSTSTSVTPDASNKSSLPPPSTTTSTSGITFPSTTSSTPPRVSGDFDDSIPMSPPRVAGPGRRSFSAVVHRGDGDNRPDSRHSTTSKSSTVVHRGDGDNRSDSRHSTTSRSSTVTPRPSSSSFKTGTDGGVVRSKRNFKHLGVVTVDPPPSPGPGDFGLAALLQDAAWLEQRLSDQTTTLTIPSALNEDGQKAEVSVFSSTTPSQANAPTPGVANSTRTKGRGLSLAPSTAVTSSNISQSPIRSAPSTPSFQAPSDALPIPPKSARGRKYFSLRSALRGQRLSVSSEMSSDDSAPVATPPSPSFDLAVQQATQGYGNDTMSIRSMFSMRSNKSGKSDSGPGSLRLSPRRSVAKASSFAERFLNRASKTKFMFNDPDDAMPERSPMLPPIIPETPGSLLSISPKSSPNNESPFDREIFDAFPSVPVEIPQRSSSYLFPVPPKTGSPVDRDFRRSATIGVPSENGGHDKAGWLRTRQES